MNIEVNSEDTQDINVSNEATNVIPMDIKEILRKNLKAVHDDLFIETPFSKRFQSFISECRLNGLSATVGAHSRNGKTWAIKDLILNSGAYKAYDGRTFMPIISIRSPESNNPNELLVSICRCFGKISANNSSILKNWLIDNIPSFGVEQLIIDDAHELNLAHLKFIKWLTDTLELQKNYRISVILVSIIEGGMISIWQKICQYKSEGWMEQVYKRFDLSRIIDGHSLSEVRYLLYCFEEAYRDFLPDIKLVDKSELIFGWLTNSGIDPQNLGRVGMEDLSDLIYHSARIACLDNNMKSIPVDLVQHVYKLYFVDKDSRVYSTESEPKYKPSNSRKVKNELLEN